MKGELVRQAQLFGTVLRDPPKEADTVNHRLLVQGGFVDQLMAGVYSYLPLGFRVLKKVEQIVREEMNAVGGQEILMPVLHPKAIWEKTGGWSRIDVLFKIKSRTGKDYALGQSEEEVVTPLVMGRVKTYKDLPLAVYQIHWKYRDELRAKSGILRGREFYMKDMYSFHENQDDFDRFYATVKEAYFRVFRRLGLVVKATEASGGTFSQKISYEFMVLTDAGEDDILTCNNCPFCVNIEIAKQKEGDYCPSCGHGTLAQAKASEVGNVFDLGQKYGKDFDLTFRGRDGKGHHAIMGCYGIGVSRLVGVIAEKFHDEKGIVWPATVAPFDVHLLSLRADEEALRVANMLAEDGFSVLLDDRPEQSAGEKFAESELIGIPVQVVVSERGVKNGEVEIRPRTDLTHATKLSLADVHGLAARARTLMESHA